MTVDMEHAVQCVDEILTEKEFVGALKDFTAAHCDIFEASDENKLEYTPIFGKYAALVEKYVDSRLVAKGVNLEQFMKDLPAYTDSPDAHPRTGAVLELLSSFDSFLAFKDMMLEAKKAKESDGHAPSESPDAFGNDLASATFLKDNLEMTRVLEEGGAKEGWTLIADKTWIQTYRKKDPESPLNLTRCFATCNMPALKFMEIFTDPAIKTKWDEDVSSCEVVGGGGWDKDGYLIRQIVKIPLLTTREMLWRWKWVRDHPEPGAHTAVVYSEPTDVPPLPNTFRVNAKSEARRARDPALRLAGGSPPPPPNSPRDPRASARPSAVGNCVVRPMEGDPSKCRVTMFAQMDMGLPAFIANHTSSNWMTRNVLKLEAAYKNMYGANAK